MARKIACTSEKSRMFVAEEKMVITGYPVRAEIRAAGRLSREEALKTFDLRPGRPTLFVFGGSRGARNINRALMAILPALLTNAQVIHISGTLTWPEVEANAATLPPEMRAFYRPYPYLHEQMGAAFRAANLVVARSGASMMGECPAFGLPAILVPLTFAWRYQKVNADFLTENGAAVQLTDETLGEKLLVTIQDLLFNPERLQAMGKAAAALDKPQAAINLAQLILAEAKANGEDNAPIPRQEASC
jgi:UDP-N-acetylglucosamine--N-acetylmuramyl-(pentapeptide) pyrophosphoryl-undecaprenol N-acetylglucosamine transferase